jgi:carbonic anhydrase/acetyltransferase-like protein (isoleucine patch superfamily)
MTLKFRLTDETRVLDDGTVVHRIAALRRGPWGPAGTRGGWVQSEENLSQKDDCWVGGEALVWGTALVTGDALVDEWAAISGHAQVRDYAVVAGLSSICTLAEVIGHAEVSGEARVEDYAVVSAYGRITGQAVVSDRAWVTDRAQIGGRAVISGVASITGSPRIVGAAVVRGHRDWACIGPLDGPHDYLTGYRLADGDLGVTMHGFAGTAAAFLRHVPQRYGTGRRARTLRAAVEALAVHCGVAVRDGAAQAPDGASRP